MTETITNDGEYEERREVSAKLEQGAEVHFTTDREDAPATDAEILENGWVRLFFNHDYSVEYHPQRTSKPSTPMSDIDLSF